MGEDVEISELSSDGKTAAMWTKKKEAAGAVGLGTGGLGP